MFQYNKRQPPTQPPLQSPSTEKMGLFSFTKRHFKLPFSLSRSKRDLSTPDKEPSKSLPPGLRQKRSSLSSSGRFSTSEKYNEGIAAIIVPGYSLVAKLLLKFMIHLIIFIGAAKRSANGEMTLDSTDKTKLIKGQCKLE